MQTLLESLQQNHRKTNQPLLQLVLERIQSKYVDPKQFDPEKMVRSSLRELSMNVPSFWAENIESKEKVIVHIGTFRKELVMKPFLGIFDVWLRIGKVLNWLKKHYQGSFSYKKLEKIAINGILKTLDKQTRVSPSHSYSKRKVMLGKIGVTLSLEQGKLWIKKVAPSSSAQQAGLLPEDQIVSLFGKKVSGQSIQYWTKKIRGLRGTRILLNVLRKGWKQPKTFVLRRSLLQNKLVQGALLPGKIGYVRLSQFQRGASLLIQAELGRIRAQAGGNLLGLILDLRNNPGGLVNEAVKICSLFVESGLAVSFAGTNIKRIDYKILPGHKEELYPMVVLLNGYSASASELLSGALMKHDRAIVLGQQSYGKGTVQSVTSIRYDTLFRYTIAQYLLPDNESIQGIGVTPDIELLPVNLEKNSIRFFSRKLNDLEVRKSRWPAFLQQNLDDLGKDSHPIPYSVHQPLTPQQKIRDWMLGKALFPQDVEIWFARYLLAHSESGKRKFFLESTQKPIQTFRKIQQKILAKQLKKLNILWKETQTTFRSKEKIKVSLQLLPLEKEKQSEISLRWIFHNHSKQNLQQIRGILESKIKDWHHKEILVGEVKSNSSKSGVLHLKIPTSALPQVELLKLRWSGQKWNFSHTSSIAVTIKGLQKPSFGWTWQIQDAFPEGNQDGYLQHGEKAKILFFIQNHSKTQTGKLLFQIKGKGLQIEEENHWIQNIPTGKKVYLSTSVIRNAGNLSEKAQITFSILGVQKGYFEKYVIVLDKKESQLRWQKEKTTKRLELPIQTKITINPSSLTSSEMTTQQPSFVDWLSSSPHQLLVSFPQNFENGSTQLWGWLPILFYPTTLSKTAVVSGNWDWEYRSLEIDLSLPLQTKQSKLSGRLVLRSQSPIRSISLLYNRNKAFLRCVEKSTKNHAFSFDFVPKKGKRQMVFLIQTQNAEILFSRFLTQLP